MGRITAAFFISPLIASLIYGQFFIIAYFIMLVATAIAALPLFMLLRKLRWLNWWHAFISGALIGLIYSIFNLYNIDVLLSRNNIVNIGMGALTGYIFWWLGIYRNKVFVFVSKSFPISSLLIVPIFAGLFYVHKGLNVEHAGGRILAIDYENPLPIPSKYCSTEIRLTNGNIVRADFWGCDWPTNVIINRCYHVQKRWSTLRFKFIYDITSSFGGNVNDC